MMLLIFLNRWLKVFMLCFKFIEIINRRGAEDAEGGGKRREGEGGEVGLSADDASDTIFEEGYVEVD